MEPSARKLHDALKHYKLFALDVLPGSNEVVGVCVGDDMGKRRGKGVTDVNSALRKCGVPGHAFFARFSDEPQDWNVVHVRNREQLEASAIIETYPISRHAMKASWGFKQEDGGIHAFFAGRKETIAFTAALHHMQMLPPENLGFSEVSSTLFGKKGKGYHVTIPADQCEQFLHRFGQVVLENGHASKLPSLNELNQAFTTATWDNSSNLAIATLKKPKQERDVSEAVRLMVFGGDYVGFPKPLSFDQNELRLLKAALPAVRIAFDIQATATTEDLAHMRDALLKNARQQDGQLRLF